MHKQFVLAVGGALLVFLLGVHVATIFTVPAPHGTEALMGLPAAHYVMDGSSLVPEAESLIPGANRGSFWAPLGYTAWLVPWFSAFSPSWVSMRALAFWAWCCALPLFFMVGRRLDLPMTSVGVAAFAWSLDRWVLQASHSGRPEMLLVAAILASLWLLLEAPRRLHRFRWLLGAGAASGVAMVLHPVGAVLIAVGLGVALIHERGLPWRHRWWWFVGLAVFLWPFLATVMANPWTLVIRQFAELLVLLGEGPLADDLALVEWVALYGEVAGLAILLMLGGWYGLIQGARSYWGWRWLLLIHTLVLVYALAFAQPWAMVCMSLGTYLGLAETWQHIWRIVRPWRQRAYVAGFCLLLTLFVSRSTLQILWERGELPKQVLSEYALWGESLHKTSDAYLPSVVSSDLWLYMAQQDLRMPDRHIFDARWAQPDIWQRQDLPWQSVVSEKRMDPLLRRWLNAQSDWCLQELPNDMRPELVAEVHYTGEGCYTLAPP